MKRIIYGAFVVSAALVAGCQQKSDQTQAREDVAEERQELAQTQREESKDVAEARQDASKDVAEEQKEANEKIADKRQDLTKSEREAAEKAGSAVTVTGEVTDVDDDSFALKTADGDKIELEAADRAAQLKQLQEGAQVRASYQMKDDERTLQNFEVIAPAAKDHDMNRMNDRTEKYDPTH